MRIRDTDSAVEFLRGLGYRVTFATLDPFGFPYWHLWEGTTPLLMSEETLCQRARIEARNHCVAMAQGR